MFGRKRVFGGSSAGRSFKKQRVAPARVFRNRAPRRVARIAQPELKYVDLVQASYVADSVGSVTPLNLIAVGDDNTTRDGRQVHLRSVHIQGLLTPVDGSTLANLARLMIVWDKQPSSANTAPAITDILAQSTSIAGTNLNNRERFQIIRDLRFPQGLSDATATLARSDGDNTHVVNCFVNLKDVKTTYSNTTAVIASISTGSLLMVTIGNQGVGFGGAFAVATRVRYFDG